MVSLSVRLAGVELKNPVIPASGTFGYGREYAELYDLDLLGSFSWKGTTAESRPGNPQPRIAETASGMLNAVGLQNPGIDTVIAEEVPNIAKIFHGPVIANVGGFSLQEYAENCAKLNDVEQVSILEVNISCPNVHAGGKNFGSDPRAAAEVTRTVKAVTKKRVFMKLSPNVTDIAEIARACADAGADGICLINTLLGMRIDLKTKKPLIANRTGGLSGPAVFPVAVRMVWDVYEAVQLPIMAKDVIIALDFPTKEETLHFLDQFPAGEKPFVKIGMELFYAEGPDVVREIKARGHKIFLDLKLHDIPNTVKRAMAVLSRLDVDMVNLHAAGTSEMMRAALEGLTRPDGTRPLLIAVTQLTSTDAAALKNELLIDTPMAETVLSYAKNAAASGLDGVVCSPLEAALVKERCGADFLTVTPGIRFADSAAGDQKRIMTPEKAGKSGCDYIVVGRPITQAEDPVSAYRRAVKDFWG